MPAYEFVTSEGNTVEEAVGKALKTLNITEGQAKIEVISEGKSGFLGVGNKSAKVKVSLSEDALAEQELTGLLGNLDLEHENVEQLKNEHQELDRQLGMAEVSNGRVVITDPKIEGGARAVIRPGSHIKLLVNDQEVTGPVSVSAGDIIRVEMINDKPVARLLLSFGDRKTEAYLTLATKAGAKYRLTDQPLANELIVLAEVAETIEPDRLTPEAVETFLHQNQIVQGIARNAIAEVLANPNSSERTLVALGKKPVDGVNATVSCPPLEKKKEDIIDDDYFGRRKVRAVTPGDVIAVKVPGIVGESGVTVTGEIIEPREPEPCELIVRGDCVLEADGERAVADANGHALLDTVGGRTIVTVGPIHEVKEVNQISGDIKANTDVDIARNVPEGYKVETDGSIEVHGFVTKADLKAGASVLIHKRVFGSTIVAGGLAALNASIMSMLLEIRQLLATVSAVAGQLQAAPGFKTSDLQAKGDGPLIQLLLDSKFQTLPEKILQLCDTVRNSDYTVLEEVSKLKNLLSKNLCGDGPSSLNKLESLGLLNRAIEQVCNLLTGHMRKIDFIKVRHVQDSSILSSGDVFVDGQGIYGSTIAAGGDVSISGHPGLARGVRVVSNGNVWIKELQSDPANQTFVKVKKSGRIFVEHLHPDTIIGIGKETLKVDRVYHKVNAYLGTEGKITIEEEISC